jgi:hypothetical protein
VYLTWVNELFFAFNEISELRAFSLGQNSDSPASTISRYPFTTVNTIGFTRVRRRIPVHRAIADFYVWSILSLPKEDCRRNAIKRLRTALASVLGPSSDAQG